jgi:hypothetical protein
VELVLVTHLGNDGTVRPSLDAFGEQRAVEEQGGERLSVIEEIL